MKSQMVLGIVLTLTLVGCGGQSEVASHDDHNDHTIFVHGRSLLPRGGNDALVEGTLVTRDGCVLLEQEESDIAYPVVWPSGTSIASDDPFTLELPSGQELAVGQTVSGGGGYHDASSARMRVEVPAACLPDTGEVAVFNPDADPSVIE